MRLIHRKALLALVAVALISSFALAPAVAGAAKQGQAPTTRTLNRKLNRLSATVKKIAKNLKDVTGVVNGGIPIITQLVQKLTDAGAGLTALQSGLTSLSAAVQNTTTGLPGLNAARSLIGAVASNTATSGSEFTLVGHAPGGGATGAYVLSFKDGAGNAADVSKRVIEVTSANPLQVGTTFSAINCANTAASATCGAVVGAADAKPTDVLVVTSKDNQDFQVAAISG